MKSRVAQPLVDMFIRAKSDLEVLETRKRIVGQNAPNAVEFAAIERIQQIIRNSVMSTEDSFMSRNSDYVTRCSAVMRKDMGDSC
jgi:hypothetical protein